MSIRKYMAPVFTILIIILVVAPAAMGQLQSMIFTGGVTTYNRFLVADLGLTGTGGKSNSIFSLQFGGTGSGLHYLYVEVRNESGQVLLNGNTGQTDYSNISGKTIYNYQINSIFGSGDISVSDSAKKLQDIVLATGALPKGTFTIEVTLYQVPSTPSGTRSVNITIDPPYLQPIAPVNVSVTRDSLNFRWVTNIDDGGTDPVEFHMFNDPRGNREVREGGAIPQRSVPGSSLDGSVIAPFLTDGTTYYWQIWGKITTSHGEERVKSALSQFAYFEETISAIALGLTDVQKEDIKNKLDEILKELVNRRAANSIKAYELDRVVLDNGVVTYDEIMKILSLIKQKQATVSAIYFK